LNYLPLSYEQPLDFQSDVVRAVAGARPASRDGVFQDPAHLPRVRFLSPPIAMWMKTGEDGKDGKDLAAPGQDAT